MTGAARITGSALVAGMLLMAAFGATAQDDVRNIALAKAWYDALQAADAEALGAMLAPQAEIVLPDLDLSQTRAEFIESLDEWKDAIEGGTIRHRIDRNAATAIALTVCYAFQSGEFLAAELLELDAEGRIARSTQTGIGEACGDL